MSAKNTVFSNSTELFIHIPTTQHHIHNDDRTLPGVSNGSEISSTTTNVSSSSTIHYEECARSDCTNSTTNALIRESESPEDVTDTKKYNNSTIQKRRRKPEGKIMAI